MGRLCVPMLNDSGATCSCMTEEQVILLINHTMRMLDDGKIDATTEFDLNDHCALVEKMDAADVFKTELSSERIQNLANYAVTLPSEAFMKLWTIVGKGDVLENTTALHSTTTDSGVKVSSYIVEILTGKTSE